MPSGWGSRVGTAVIAITAGAAVAGFLQALRNSQILPHLETNSPKSVDEPVTVLVPARDEEETITDCVAGLLAQDKVSQLSLEVLDDASSDNTAHQAVTSANGDSRFSLRKGAGEPPAGWLGKTWACHQLAQHATGSVYVFVDADVRLSPEAIAAAVTQLRSRKLAFLSAWPHQKSQTPLARLVQPLQQWSWLTTLPLDLAESGSDPRLAAANGQFLVMDADAYRQIGGHSSVRDEVLDDIELARSFKRAGYRTGLADASQVAECLMYQTDREVIAGYSKSLWRAFGSPRNGIAVAGSLLGIYLVPVLALRQRGIRRFLGALGYAAGVANRIVAARTTGGKSWPDAILHPVSVTAFAGLTLISVRRHRLGQNSWRGRPVSIQST